MFSEILWWKWFFVIFFSSTALFFVVSLFKSLLALVEIDPDVSDEAFKPFKPDESESSCTFGVLHFGHWW